MPTEEQLNAIAHEIIGAAIAVHRRIGNGCFERTYSPCLAYEFQQRGLDFKTEVALPLKYGDLVIPRACVSDYIVAGLIVVELKVLAKIGPIEEQQMQTYLRLSGCPLGLILNFGAKTMKDGITRRVNNFPHGTSPADLCVPG